MDNLDRILLKNTMAADEDARQFCTRMDILKDKEQDEMWAFIRGSLCRRRKKTRNQNEKEIDNARKLKSS